MDVSNLTCIHYFVRYWGLTRDPPQTCCIIHVWFTLYSFTIAPISLFPGIFGGLCMFNVKWHLCFTLMPNFITSHGFFLCFQASRLNCWKKPSDLWSCIKYQTIDLPPFVVVGFLRHGFPWFSYRLFSPCSVFLDKISAVVKTSHTVATAKSACQEFFQQFSTDSAAERKTGLVWGLLIPFFFFFLFFFGSLFHPFDFFFF